jgi:hypothetical protein
MDNDLLKSQACVHCGKVLENFSDDEVLILDERAIKRKMRKREMNNEVGKELLSYQGLGFHLKCMFNFAKEKGLDPDEDFLTIREAKRIMEKERTIHNAFFELVKFLESKNLTSVPTWRGKTVCRMCGKVFPPEKLYGVHNRVIIKLHPDLRKESSRKDVRLYAKVFCEKCFGELKQKINEIHQKLRKEHNITIRELKKWERGENFLTLRDIFRMYRRGILKERKA